MQDYLLNKRILKYLCVFVFLLLVNNIFSQNNCTKQKHSIGYQFIIGVKDYPKNKAFIFENKINFLDAKNISKQEKLNLTNRLLNELDDSAKVYSIDKFFIGKRYKYHSLVNATIIDSSAKNMELSLVHLGYYYSKVFWCADTVYKRSGKQIRVYITYNIQLNKALIIDTVFYRMRRTEIQNIINAERKNSFLKKGDTITKLNVYAELQRLTDLMRNNGYYKFVGDNFKVLGDTLPSFLTNVTMSDPEFLLQAQEEAQKRKIQPTSKYYVILVNPNDSNYKPMTIRNIVVKDSSGKAILINNIPTNYISKINTNLLLDKINLKPNELYRQIDESITYINLVNAGLYSLITIDTTNVLGNKMDMVITLYQYKRGLLEINAELGSAPTPVVTKDLLSSSPVRLFTLSANSKFIDRNYKNKGGRIQYSVGIVTELNLLKKTSDKIFNRFSIPFTINSSINKLYNIYEWAFKKRKSNFTQTQSFLNIKAELDIRVRFFKSFNVNINSGFNTILKKQRLNMNFKALNIEFNKISGTSDYWPIFLSQNPAAALSYKDAFVVSSSIAFQKNVISKKNPKLRSSIKGSMELSLLPTLLGIEKFIENNTKSNLSNFIKPEFEWKQTKTIKKNNEQQRVIRLFIGAGISFDKNPLPFFKQFTGGGASSMRAWPINALGTGGQPFKPYTAGATVFDRTGEMKLEANIEWRKYLLDVVPGIKMNRAIFIDVGNIWNVKKSTPIGITDKTQFCLNFAKPENFLQQMAISAGYGLRLDFNYFLLRFDLGFRFKRPDIYDSKKIFNFPGSDMDFRGKNGNDVSVFFKHFFSRGENDPINGENDLRYKKWRYENMNLSIDLSVPF